MFQQVFCHESKSITRHLLLAKVIIKPRCMKVNIPSAVSWGYNIAQSECGIFMTQHSASHFDSPAVFVSECALFDLTVSHQRNKLLLQSLGSFRTFLSYKTMMQ